MMFLYTQTFDNSRFVRQDIDVLDTWLDCCFCWHFLLLMLLRQVHDLQLYQFSVLCQQQQQQQQQQKDLCCGY